MNTINYTILWILSESRSQNASTLNSLKKNLTSVAGKHEVILYVRNQSALPKELATDVPSLPGCTLSLCSADDRSDIALYQDAATKASGDYITMLYGGDRWSKDLLPRTTKRISAVSGGRPAILMTRKRDLYDRRLGFSQEEPSELGGLPKLMQNKRFVLCKTIDLQNCFDLQPLYLGGTFVRRDLFTKDRFHEEYALETERAFFMDILLETGQFELVGGVYYYSAQGREGNESIFPDVYKKEWYFESISDFWIPYLTKLKEQKGDIPLFIQYNCVYSLISRLLANKDNQNKHLLEHDQLEQFYLLAGRLLQMLSDRAVFNSDYLRSCISTRGDKLILGYLKYGLSFRFNTKEENGETWLAVGDAIVEQHRVSDLQTEIRWMNWKNDTLHIDGVIDVLLFQLADEIFMDYGGQHYPLQYNGSYALSKFFGESVYKRHPFELDLPLKGRSHREKLTIIARIGNKEIPICYSYYSHYSRMSDVCRTSHWCFGPKKRYLMSRSKDSSYMQVHNANMLTRVLWETMLLFDMFFTFDTKYWQFIIARLGYHAARPFLKRKKIWLYFDKIYKGGDSAEYLYRYAQAQKDPDIVHYYLIDKKTSDYKRLIADGYRPLVRKTLLHRLVFMHADMMVISNSTAFQFNNFGRINSSFVRDLIDSHAVCVQHGMSVQKIAMAQQRLRDNTRLYFCASKYEIENLSKPIYGYEGQFRSVLKLTGVPRHDGLVDRHKKQIMISPTWRMQASMKIRTSEGEARDYNPLFRETSYYKVYNSLINDPRLLEAAQKYGYRIKYVLHPIVSVQAKDFNKNEFVDLVPSIGDMSYEELFCESALMVTDFSGVQFDFAYMRKPVLYLHSNEIPAHYEEGTFFYDTMAFGEIAHTNDELIDLLIEYMRNDCVMKPEYVRRADDFFAFHDQNNCKRVYEEMIQYQKENL